MAFSQGAITRRMAKNNGAHPGFDKASSSIAAQQGISQKRADAILAATTRAASNKAKARNPRLKRV